MNFGAHSQGFLIYSRHYKFLELNQSNANSFVPLLKDISQPWGLWIVQASHQHQHRASSTLHPRSLHFPCLALSSTGHLPVAQPSELPAKHRCPPASATGTRGAEGKALHEQGICLQLFCPSAAALALSRWAPAPGALQEQEGTGTWGVMRSAECWMQMCGSQLETHKGM